MAAMAAANEKGRTTLSVCFVLLQFRSRSRPSFLLFFFRGCDAAMLRVHPGLDECVVCVMLYILKNGHH